MVSKIETFIRNCWYKVTYPVKKLKLYHQLLLQMDEDKLSEPTSRNPYQILSSWLLDSLQFGTMGLMFTTAIFGWQGHVSSLLLVIGLGFIPSLIRDLRKAILGEH